MNKVFLNLYNHNNLYVFVDGNINGTLSVIDSELVFVLSVALYSYQWLI